MRNVKQKARCKPGDLAIIARDVPSCAGNIGRVVGIFAPMAINRQGQPTWLIRPVTPAPYMLNDQAGSFIGFMKATDNNIEHPDAWMVPIRPDEVPAETVETKKVPDVVEQCV